MLPVTLAPEPATFDDRVRQPGHLALHERIGATPPRPRIAGRPCKRALAPDGNPITRFEDLTRAHIPPYWTRAIPDLMTAYHRICHYACFAIHEITGAASVDHMIPLSDAWDRIYEWDNFRLACTTLNARKSDLREVLDPFEIGDTWFRMDFRRFRLHPGHDLPPEITARIDDTITRLKLNAGFLCTRRQKDYTRYRDGRIDFDTLLEESPLVARELTRDPERLHPQDAHRATTPPATP